VSNWQAEARRKTPIEPGAMSSGEHRDELPAANGQATAGQRIDKWLWFARAAKTRTLCATLVMEGKVRVNGTKVDKSSHIVKVGDTVTLIMRQRMRILKVVGLGLRRGSAELAAALYEDLTPVPVKPEVSTADAEQLASIAQRDPGSGRPTKRQRREMERFKFRST
jgi:ribosome-associated heat shock protein Hsp15